MKSVLLLAAGLLITAIPARGELMADARDPITQLSRMSLEELAQVVFFQAVEECYPEKLAAFDSPRWVNASLHRPGPALRTLRVRRRESCVSPEEWRLR